MNDMGEEYGHIPDGFLLNPEEVEKLRNKKYELTEYGKQRLREMMTHEEMLEEAAKREAANKAALESLGIDYESFGQKPWNEGDLDYEAPNGDYIKNYPLINRVEVIGKNGREYVQYDCSNVQVSMQDQGRTLKVFLS
jgi:hypothetical protein